MANVSATIVLTIEEFWQIVQKMKTPARENATEVHIAVYPNGCVLLGECDEDMIEGTHETITEGSKPLEKKVI